MAGQPEHICQLAEAGRGWRRLEAALSLIQRWRGVHITWRTHHSAMAPSSWCRPSMLDTCAGKWASLKSGAWAVCAPSVLMLAVWQAVAQAAVESGRDKRPDGSAGRSTARQKFGEVNEEVPNLHTFRNSYYDKWVSIISCRLGVPSVT